MNQDQTLYSKIDAFLNGTLSEPKHKEFEAELAKDSLLQEKVNDSRLANAALSRMKLWEMKALTEEIDREEKQTQKIKKTVATVAGLSLLIAASISVYLIVSEKDTKIEKTEPKPKTTHLLETPKGIVPDSPAPIVPKPKKTTAVENRAVVSIQTKTEIQIEEKPITETAPKIVVAHVPITEIVAEQSAQKTEPKKPENACEKTKIEEVVFVEKTCLDQQTGRIQVSNIKGGTQPYRITILNEAKQTVSTSLLGGGHYSIRITDALECSKTIENVVVKEIDCRKDFELNIGNGEILELGVVSKPAILSIYDLAGNTYFYKEFAKGERIHWDGIPTQGEARSGYFQFNVSYQEGESRMGSITVVR